MSRLKPLELVQWTASPYSLTQRLELKGQQVLGRQPERICHTIAKAHHGCNEHCFCNLMFKPSQIEQPLHIFRSGLEGFAFHFIEVEKQFLLGFGEPCQIVHGKVVNSLPWCPLNHEKEAMAVKAIGADIELRNICCDHLLLPTREYAIAKEQG